MYWIAEFGRLILNDVMPLVLHHNIPLGFIIICLNKLTIIRSETQCCQLELEIWYKHYPMSFLIQYLPNKKKLLFLLLVSYNWDNTRTLQAVKFLTVDTDIYTCIYFQNCERFQIWVDKDENKFPTYVSKRVRLMLCIRQKT